MRIDGLSTAYTPERSPKAHAGSAYQAIVHEQQVRREQAPAASTSQGLTPYPLTRQVEAPTPSAQIVQEPLSLAEIKRGDSYLGSLSLRALEALSAYTRTAGFTDRQDAFEVLGLDVYA